ncbi:MAG: hypothetical protein ACE5FI_18820, partial [Anaerolineales bacterium]
QMFTGGLSVLSADLRRSARLPFAILLLLPGLAMSLRLDWIFTQTDTRDLATMWINEHLPARSTLLLDVDISVTPSRQSLIQQAERYPDSLGVKDQWLRDLPESSFPRPAFDVYRLWIYSPETPEELAMLAATQQPTWAVFANRTLFPRDDWPYTFFVSASERAYMVSPILDPARFSDAPLPGDLSRAWRDLWAVDRPGPIVEIYWFE